MLLVIDFDFPQIVHNVLATQNTSVILPHSEFQFAIHTGVQNFRQLLT